MIKVNVGMSRKVSQDFNSTGFSVNLEGEIGGTLDDPERVIEQIRQYYDLAEGAIQDQIDRYESDSAIASRDQPPPPPQPQRQPAPTSAPSSNRQRNGHTGNYQRRTGPTSPQPELVPATPKQVQFLKNLATREGLSEPQLNQRIADILGEPTSVGQLTKNQAAKVLDVMTQSNSYSGNR